MTQLPLLPLLGDLQTRGFLDFHRRLQAAGYPELRASHGCVFRYVDEDGMRLTDLSDKARVTKQAIGEVVDELEQRGYVERAADPEDGRAKIIRLTDSGAEAQAIARRIFAEIERDWAEQIGPERVAALREAVEALAALELSLASA